MVRDSRDIVVLAPQRPFPPEQGAALRNFHIVAHLARSWRVHLVYFGPPPIPAILLELCASVHCIMPSQRSPMRRLVDFLLPDPDLAYRLRSSAFAATVRTVIQRYQPYVVQYEGLELFRFVTALGMPTIYDAHNAEWTLQYRSLLANIQKRRWIPAGYSLVQMIKLRRYERQAVRQAACTIAVSEADRRDLVALLPQTEVAVIQNGVDPRVYMPLTDVAPMEESLLFAGKMDFRPNVEGVLWLVREVLPRLWRERPALRLVVFGASPTLEVLALARQDRRIVVTGYVPGVEAERRALAEAQVVTVPLFSGGGTRLKVLNALASARPVVSTTLGASGFDLRDGEHLLLADHPAAFASAVSRLLNDRSLAQRLAEQGRAQVVTLYSWERLLPALDRIYAEVASGYPH